ncbi:MAG: hypothetical protein AAB849_01800 [Patescibacteria group bacterium]
MKIPSWSIAITAALTIILTAGAVNAQSEETKLESPASIEENNDNSEKPTISNQEIKDFQREFRDLQKQVKELLGQLAKVKGAEEWKNTVSEINKSAADCLARFAQAGIDEKRDIMDECRSAGLWENMNEIRDEFVPPQELKRVLQDIKNQTRDLLRYKKQLSKISADADAGQLIATLLAQLETFKNNITNNVGRDQRDAMQDYWDAQIWEELNKVRAFVELPREMKNVQRDLKIVQKSVQNKSYKTAFAFFGVDEDKLFAALVAKQGVVEQILSLMNQGDAAEAFALVEEDIHQGWHPGDLRHLTDMLRETHQRLKTMKDADILEQVKEVLSPIIDTLNDGDIREARDAMVQFTDQMQKYERVFQRYYGGEREIDAKTSQALEKLEGLIQQKLNKEETNPKQAIPSESTE